MIPFGAKASYEAIFTDDDGSNLLLRGPKEGVSPHVWRGRALVCGTQLSLWCCCRCTVSLSPCARHFGSKPETRVYLVCSLFCAHATSLSGRDCHSHLLFVCLLLTVRFKTLSCTLLSLRRLVRFAGLDRIWSRSSNLDQRRTLLPSLDDSEGCATTFGFSKNLCCSQHVRLFPTQLLRHQPNSAKQSLQSQSPCQHIATCSGLQPPRPNGQARSGAARRQDQLREGWACTMEAAMHARVVTHCHELSRTSPGSRRMRDARPGPLDFDTWSACWRVHCVLQGDPSTGSQELLVV